MISDPVLRTCVVLFLAWCSALSLLVLLLWLRGPGGPPDVDPWDRPEDWS